MTKEEFAILSVIEQEAFLASGCMAFSPSITPSPSIEPALQREAEHVSAHIPETPLVQFPSLSFGTHIDDGLDIKNPVELLFLVDKDVSSGKVKLHKWQIRFMLDFAIGGLDESHPFQAVVRACNGSGKDKYIIAACAVWFCMRWKKAKCPTTSSSGFQLDTQTCFHTRRLAEAVNRYFGYDLWDCKYRQYTFHFDNGSNEFNSQILCYATDEAKKAEGFHPTDSGTKMAIFCSEDKSIPDEINDATNKCSGYTHRVHASTPGNSMGHFYDYCMGAIKRAAIKLISEVSGDDWIEYHIKADDCPHLGGPSGDVEAYKRRVAKNIAGGVNSSAYKSQVDAEFGIQDGEMIVIPFTYIWQATHNTFQTVHIPEPFNTGGLDLSDGGDETAFTIRNGNKHIKTIPFKFYNTEDTIAFLDELFREHGFQNPEALIYGDSVGIGKPILNRLVKMGWRNIRFFDSRAASIHPKVNANRNTDVWMNTRQLFERHEIIMDGNDSVLCKQLSSRHYKLKDAKIQQMWTKLEEKKQGFPSPDRADSFNYAFWSYKSTMEEAAYDEDSEKKPFALPPVKPTVNDFSMRNWATGPDEAENKWSADTKDKDFSLLSEEIADYNKRLLSQTK